MKLVDILEAEINTPNMAKTIRNMLPNVSHEGLAWLVCYMNGEEDDEDELAQADSWPVHVLIDTIMDRVDDWAHNPDMYDKEQKDDFIELVHAHAHDSGNKTVH